MLRRAERGERLVVTVDGRPVAEGGPPQKGKRLADPAKLEMILGDAPADAAWSSYLMQMREEDRAAAADPWFD